MSTVTERSKSLRAIISVLALSLLGLPLRQLEPLATASDAMAESEAAIGFPSIRLEKLVDGLVNPLGIIAYPGIEDRLLVVEQRGTVRAIDLKAGEPAVIAATAFLDLQDRVVAGGEKGLLGFAFHPEFRKNGKLYVNYTAKDPGLKTIISEFKFSPALGRVDEKTERRILTFEQPYENHNGGQIAFGPDGMLYIGTGDGGAAFDPHFNGQSKKTLLGKILRIDVSPSENYAIPKDNPFAGVSDLRGEIWAYGLRNPWRFSFDPKTGELWVADVGQNKMEEIDLVTKGGNYGWNIVEGTNCLSTRYQCVDPSLIPPIFTYGRDQGFSITGGYVYRGSKIPALEGTYVYGDFGSGRIWALRRRREGTGSTVESKQLLQVGMGISSFGVDDAGELYVADHRNGAIHRVIPGL